MNEQTLWIVAALSAGTLIGTFWRMRGGFGPMNLRAVGLVLIAALASILAIGQAETLTAAMGLLGAIAGYLFGAKSTKSEEASASVGSSVDAQGANFGDNARVAGRDINETVNNIERMLSDVQSMAHATVQNLNVLERGQRLVLKRKRQESIRWECHDPQMLHRLQQLRTTRPNDWTQDWIDLCLDHPDCQSEIRTLVKRNAHLGWNPSGEVSFDNIGDGLHVGIAFERALEIPGLLRYDA